MDSTPPAGDALALVQRGWNQLKRERPLAAWAAWQQALRLAPGHAAAEQALALLAASPRLPAAATRVYRFRTPAAPAARTAWDARFRAQNLEDLALAASAFFDLATSDPTDSAAWFNRALCLAWQGENAQAIAALERSVALDAPDRPSPAVEAWTLAEVLRQGAEAEHLADDLSHSLTIAWHEDDPDPTSLGSLLPVTTSASGTIGAPQLRELSTYEWLDRPMPAAEAVLRFDDLPRLLATVVHAPGALRLSSPQAGTLGEVHTRVEAALADEKRPARAESRPLPLALLDAAVWTFRMPPGLDASYRAFLTRAALEHYHENVWIHIPRHGLDGKTPLEAGAAATAGDTGARVKLDAVVLVREQLAARPSATALYEGYPFDRLRRRVGLAPYEAESVDRDDYTCMCARELDQIDPQTLGPDLLDAYNSAAGLRDDARTARFAEALLASGPEALSRVAAVPLYATLVRQALAQGQPTRALQWIDHATQNEAVASESDRRALEAWRAEIHLRDHDPEAAARVFSSLLQRDPPNAMLAIEAANTMLDHGEARHARTFAERALERAAAAGDTMAQSRARALLAAASADASTSSPAHRTEP